ncbi:hypothetical protein Tco_0130633 [Tanacetum coccineum]
MIMMFRPPSRRGALQHPLNVFLHKNTLMLFVQNILFRRKFILNCPDATMHERPVGMYTRFFDYANYRIPFSTFFVSVLTHFRIPFPNCRSAKVSHFEILCRVCNIEPSVSLLWFLLTLGLDHPLSAEALIEPPVVVPATNALSTVVIVPYSGPSISVEDYENPDLVDVVPKNVTLGPEGEENIDASTGGDLAFSKLDDEARDVVL